MNSNHNTTRYGKYYVVFAPDEEDGQPCYSISTFANHPEEAARRVINESECGYDLSTLPEKVIEVHVYFIRSDIPSDAEEELDRHIGEEAVPVLQKLAKENIIDRPFVITIRYP